jgi:hypothetical protein
MNRRVLVAALVVGASMVSAPAAAQGLTGTWEVTSEGRRGPQTTTLALVQSGTSLTGTLTMTGGGGRGGRGGGGGAREVEISDGEIDGTSFTFTVTLAFGNNSIEQTYSGTIDGDEMSGTIEGGRGGGRPFTGKRGG